MRVVIRREILDNRIAGRHRYRQSVFNVARIGIGRGAEQLIQIPDPRMATAHAVIERRGKEFLLRVLVADPIEVNGVAQYKATLRKGDVLVLADARLAVEDIRVDRVIVLRLSVPAGQATSELVDPDALSLKDTGLRKTRASWVLVLAVLGIALVAPLLASLSSHLRGAAMMPSDALWLPGPLHRAHQSIGGDCNACHSVPFKRVMDAVCITCHRGTQHHVPVDKAASRLFASKLCADCHVEHGKPSQLVDRGSGLCVTCHGNLPRLEPDTPLQNAVDFGSDHPDFSLSLLEPQGQGTETAWHSEMVRAGSSPANVEHSNLIFSHEAHLDPRGIKSPSGEQVMVCEDCHRPDSSGRTMLPIRMETHCARCHQLLYDENDVTSAVPHGSLPRMFTALQEHFSRMFLQSQGAGSAQSGRRRPGGEQGVITRDEQRRALDWTTRQSLQAARELLDRRVCVECHKVSRRDGAGGFDQWQVEPVRLNSSWMPRAQFNHAAHRVTNCTACHRRAQQSRVSGDVLMPTITECRGCHGGSKQSRRVASTCIMCHQFHLPGRGAYTAGSPNRASPTAGVVVSEKQ